MSFANLLRRKLFSAEGTLNRHWGWFAGKKGWRSTDRREKRFALSSD